MLWLRIRLLGWAGRIVRAFVVLLLIEVVLMVDVGLATKDPVAWWYTQEVNVRGTLNVVQCVSSVSLKSACSSLHSTQPGYSRAPQNQGSYHRDDFRRRAHTVAPDIRLQRMLAIVHAHLP